MNESFINVKICGKGSFDIEQAHVRERRE